MDTAANKQTARRFYELFNAGDLSGIADLAVEDYAENDPLPGQGTGRDGLVDRVSMLVGALAPHFTVEDVVAEGDRVVVRWSQTGTHVGEFFGAPGSGRSFVGGGIDIYRMAEDGRLAEHWHQVDLFGLLSQLGLVQ